MTFILFGFSQPNKQIIFAIDDDNDDDSLFSFQQQFGHFLFVFLFSLFFLLVCELFFYKGDALNTKKILIISFCLTTQE